MDLVDEEHIVLLQRGQDTCQIAWFVEHGTRGNLKTDTEFIGNNV